MIAPFLSSLLVRQPQYAAQYEEDPALQQAPPLGYFPAPDMPQPQPVYAPLPSYAVSAPAPTPVVARAEPVPLSTSAPSAPVAASVASATTALVPTAPMLPRAVPAPFWPTPGLPAIAAAATNSASDADAVAVKATNENGPPVSTLPRPARSGPPGSEAASPPPTAGDAARAVTPDSTPQPETPPTTAASTSAPASLPAPSLPAFTTGPAPFTARPVPADAPGVAAGETRAETPFILEAVNAPATEAQAEKLPVLRPRQTPRASQRIPWSGPPHRRYRRAISSRRLPCCLVRRRCPRCFRNRPKR